MGYFKRKLDRRRSRDEARSLVNASLDDRPWEAIPGSPPKVAYLRFATSALHPETSRRTGVFAAAYERLDDPEVDPHDAALVRDALAWFEKNLRAPTIDEPRAVFLFKAVAAECMQHIWTLAAAMREAPRVPHGVGRASFRARARRARSPRGRCGRSRLAGKELPTWARCCPGPPWPA